MKYIGIVKEPDFEKRICFLPKEISAAINQLNLKVFIEKGIGENLGISDSKFEKAGAIVQNRSEILERSDFILSINEPQNFNIGEAEKTIIGYFNMLFYPQRTEKYLNKNISVFSLDLLPRTTLAQSMDVLSSMASLAGYKAVLKATNYYNSSFPMFTTAAGTLSPAKVLVLGAGVAGLQAIATAKRLGAIVEAFDVRKSSEEEVKSLGAKFIEVEGYKEGKNAGGYAVEQSKEYLAKQKELIHQHISKANIVISTANIPGKKAPVLIDSKALEAMQPGSVIIDLAAEQGGNCIATQNGKIINHNSVTIIGDSFLSREIPQAASQLLSSNYFNFLKHLVNSNKKEDPILSGCQVIYNGKITHPQLLTKFEIA
ncbi:NAD(P) transhydrogenase subunit alpha [Aquimarina muelleri]|uniref:NAD(P) transhydrogenase subunit alpha n=1 Tax=Aquimarina muelleri TaxID=279356 RepID=UPI003F688D79